MTGAARGQPATGLQNLSPHAVDAMASLAGYIGHDLRNPLAAIRNAHYFIGRQLDDAGLLAAEPRVSQFMAIIEAELTYCSKVIAELLDFARDRPLTRTATPVPTLMKDAVAGVTSRPGVAIEVVAAKDLPILTVDQDLVRRAIGHLIQNGVDAIPPSRPGHVRVVAAREEELVVVRVHDDGVGISESERELVFRPLFSTKLRGAGLGLAIVHSVVTRHGGTLTFESNGEGTTFTITLPVK